MIKGLLFMLATDIYTQALHGNGVLALGLYYGQRGEVPSTLCVYQQFEGSNDTLHKLQCSGVRGGWIVVSSGYQAVLYTGRM